MPRFRPRPCSWICLPTAMRTLCLQAFAVTGTQRRPVRRGAFEAAWAAPARPISASTNTSPQTIVATRSLMGRCNR